MPEAGGSVVLGLRDEYEYAVHLSSVRYALSLSSITCACTDASCFFSLCWAGIFRGSSPGLTRDWL